MTPIDCTRFAHDLDDRLDGRLADANAHAVDTHAASCASCEVVMGQAQTLQSRLRDLPVPSPRPGFAGAALRRARMANVPARAVAVDRRRDLLFAFGGAAAASLCLAVAVLTRHLPVASPSPMVTAAMPEGLETVSLTVGQVEPVRLRIDAPRDFEVVRFSVELPDRVWLASQPGVRSITWEGALRKGVNVLELSLVAQNGAAGLMTARVLWGDHQQQLHTRLVGVDSPSATGAALAPGAGGT